MTGGVEDRMATLMQLILLQAEDHVALRLRVGKLEERVKALGSMAIETVLDEAVEQSGKPK